MLKFCALKDQGKVMFGLGKKNEIEKKLKFTLPKEELQKDYDKRVASQQFSSTVKGYRKGKAPKEAGRAVYCLRWTNISRLGFPRVFGRSWP